MDKFRTIGTTVPVVYYAFAGVTAN